jgi:transcriptional regulator with XRE-family HTH domain
MLRVLALRKSRGWTQRELSEKSGVSRSFISELERDGHMATIDTLCKLCRGLEVTPNELIEEKYWR